MSEPTNKNIYRAFFYREAGCSYEDEEFLLEITDIISGSIGSEDYRLVYEALVNCGLMKDTPSENVVGLRFAEAGEWEGYHWHKYYDVEIEVARDE